MQDECLKTDCGDANCENFNLKCILYSPSQPHRGDQAGPAHTVKAPAFPIPSGGEILVYSLRWCWDQ